DSVSSGERTRTSPNHPDSSRWGCRTGLPSMGGVTKVHVSRTGLERPTLGGDSPVCGTAYPPVRHLSTAQHAEVSRNPAVPSRKAKYSLATDSEPSSASERWEEPLSGEVSEPETTCLQAVRARLAPPLRGRRAG